MDCESVVCWQGQLVAGSAVIGQECSEASASSISGLLPTHRLQPTISAQPSFLASAGTDTEARFTQASHLLDFTWI